MINSTKVKYVLRDQTIVMTGKNREHLYYIDILRIVSVTAVILAHAHLEFVHWMYWSVLIFTAISGAMMLNRDKIDIKRLYTHNIWRIVTAFIFWSTVYSLVQHLLFPLLDGNQINIKMIVTSLVEGQYHMWYCYMITGLFMLSPCFKAVIDKDKDLGIYFCIIAFVFSLLIPALQNIEILKWTASPVGNMGLNGLRFSFYFVLGYYLATYDFSPAFRKVIYIAGIFCVALYLIFPETAFMTVFETGVVILLYVGGRYLIKISNDRLKKTVSTLADAVFAVYLIHDLFNIIYVRLFGSVHSPLYDLGKFCFTLALSFVSAVLIRKCRKISAYIS